MRSGVLRRQLALMIIATAVVAGGAITARLAPATAAAAPKQLSTAFTAADVGFAEGGIRPQMVEKFDAMDAYVGAKKPIIRVDLDWASVEPADDEFHWNVVDTVVNGANARGMRVLLVLAYSPAWANGGHAWSEGQWLPTSDAAWVDMVNRVVERYGDRVQAYEVWNEPNMSMFGHFKDPGTGQETVAARKKRYWELVKLAYPRLKAGCPACTVLAGGSAVGDPPADLNNNPNTADSWLKAGYDAGARGFFDAVAHHPYPAWNSGLGPAHAECEHLFWNQFGPPLYTHPTSGRTCGGELAVVRKVMVAHGDSAKKIWGTEFGYPTAGADIPRLPREHIRNYLVEGVYMWRALDYTGPLFLYSFRDAAPGENSHCAGEANSPECHFGVTTAANEPKEPLFSYLSDALGGAWQSQLEPDQALRQESALRSANGRFYLWLHKDGNLVLYEAATAKASAKVLWQVTGLGGTRLINQNDANLQLLNGQGRSVWNSRTGSGGYTPTRLVLRNDGNLVLYRVSDQVALWSTNTRRPPRR